MNWIKQNLCQSFKFDLMLNFIPVSEPDLNGNEKKYLNECIDTGWISSEGPFVERFERAFSGYVGRSYGIAVCNGSAALEVALLAMDFEEGDEIIVPSFTIISCISAILRVKAVPVLVDSDANTWNMDVSRVVEKITSRTKAIMVVHIYGLPVDMDAIVTISRTYGLRIIEDAAEMHGQKYKGIPCGSFGDVSVFSFYANKIVTTGEGGMVLTNSPEIAERCFSIRNLCFNKQRRFVHDRIGFNFRMTNLQAAIGLAQLERIDLFVERKREIGIKYTSHLCVSSNLQLPMTCTSYARNIYWVYGVLLRESCPVDAPFVMAELHRRGIGTRPFFYPMHRQPVFRRMKLFGEEHLPVAEALGDRGFYLPSGSLLTDEQIQFVSNSLREVVEDV